MHNDAFWREYTSQDAVLKYSRITAGSGISYLLDHDYGAVYLQSLRLLPTDVRPRGIRMLEFGCGAGMNLLHLVASLGREGIQVERAVGSDFSPILIEAAGREAKNYLGYEDQRKVRFCVARNETLVDDLSAALGESRSGLENSFHFIFGVNTIRYCHRAKKQLECAQAIFDLLAPGGACVVIDMNNRFPLFRSELNNLFSGRKRVDERYLPSLEELAAPFADTGFEVLRREHFCWIPHSSGPFTVGFLKWLTPVLNSVARSRAMRSLVVSRKPLRARASSSQMASK
jgi:SAM-dependent methyltransferase